MKASFCRFVVFMMLMLALCSQKSYSQNALVERGSVGLSCALQENQFDILLPIRVTSGITIAPAVGVTSLEGSGTDLRFGLEMKNYFSNKALSPFFGLRSAMLMAIPTEGPTVSDWLLGVSGGGEYFFSGHFSVGVEAQLNLAISNHNSFRFGNPGRNTFNTATAAFATIYF